MSRFRCSRHLFHVLSFEINNVRSRPFIYTSLVTQVRSPAPWLSPVWVHRPRRPLVREWRIAAGCARAFELNLFNPFCLKFYCCVLFFLFVFKLTEERVGYCVLECIWVNSENKRVTRYCNCYCFAELKINDDNKKTLYLKILST